MSNIDLINKRIKELDSQYEEAQKQLLGLENTIVNLKKYAGYIVRTGEFNNYPKRMSDESWRRRATEMIKELMKIDKETYPTFNSVLVPIYLRLRDVYGVVLDQLRKDFRYNTYTLRYPSAFEAISADDTIREIFDSLLMELFPADYFDDEVLSSIYEGGDEVACVKESPEEIIMKIIIPLAAKCNDDSYGYINTFNNVCENMGCSWNNLQTRFMHKNNLEKMPSKLTVIVGNDSVLRKFKKTVRVMLENCDNI